MFEIVLISAEEAAIRTKAANDKASDEQEIEIVNSIEKAIQNGEYSVKIPQRLFSKNRGIFRDVRLSCYREFLLRRAF